MSREKLMAVEVLLKRAQIKSNLIMEALVHEARNIPPSDDGGKHEGALTSNEICLLIARLRANNIPYHEVLRAVIPDYQAKTNILTNQTDSLDFYPVCYPTLHGDWKAKSNIVFNHTDHLTAYDLLDLMAKTFCHSPQYTPQCGVTEMATCKHYYGSKLTLPIFSPYVSPEGLNKGRPWQALADINYLPGNQDLWKKGIAPAGTKFMAVCEKEFFETSLAR